MYRKIRSTLRLDNVRSRHKGPLFSVMGEEGEELENGMIGTIGDPVVRKDIYDNSIEIIERELLHLDPIKGNDIPIVLVGSDEIIYQEYSKVDNSKQFFYTPAGMPAKAYGIFGQDVFSVSKVKTLAGEGSEVAKVGSYVIPEAGERYLTEVADKPATGAFIGKVERIDKLGTATIIGGTTGTIQRSIVYNVIRVIKNEY